MKTIVIVNLIVVISGTTPEIEFGSSIQDDAVPAVADDAGIIEPEVTEKSFTQESVTAVSEVGNLKNSEPNSESTRLESPSWLGCSFECPSANGDHYFDVCTVSQTDPSECDAELRDTIVGEVVAYIDKHILEHASVSDLKALTHDYIHKHILGVNSDRVFRKIETRPGGEMYKLIRQVTIEKKQVERIKSWENQLVVSTRSTQIGVMSGITLACITVLSGMVGLLARREKAKLKG